jgi:hypothetical protein
MYNKARQRDVKTSASLQLAALCGVGLSLVTRNVMGYALSYDSEL